MSQDRNQALRDILKGASVIYAGLVIEMAVAFLAQWLAARHLSVSNFGGITTGVTLLNIGSIVASLGLERGLTRYLPRHDVDDRRRLSQVAYLITVPAAIVLGVLVALNAEFIAIDVFGDATVTPSLRIFGAAIPFAAVLSVSLGGIRGQKIPQYRVYVENLVRPLLRFGLVAAAVAYGLGQTGVALAYAVPYAVGGALALILFTRTIPGMFSLRQLDIDIGLSQDLLRYSFPFIVTRSTGFVYRSIDIFLLLYFLGSDAVGTYGVAYAVARLMLMFSTAFNFLGAPVASELESERSLSDLLSVQYSVLRWLVIASIPLVVPFAFFAADFIAIVYRPQYAAGGSALAVLAIGFAVHNVFSAQGNLMEAFGNSRELAFNSTVAAAVNVGLNLVLIPRYGILGAAVATIIAYLAIDALMLIELYSHTGELVLAWRVFSPIAIALPLLAGTWWLSLFVPGTLLWITVVSAAFGGVYLLAVVIVLGINDDEVMLIKSAQERFGIEIAAVNYFVDRFS